MQALLDIQEFYELTLMDDGKTSDIKATEAIEMAARWEMTNRPFAMAAVAAAQASAGPNSISSSSSKPPELMRPGPSGPGMPASVKDELLNKLPELRPAIDEIGSSINSNNSSATNQRHLSGSATTTERAAPFTLAQTTGLVSADPHHARKHEY